MSERHIDRPGDAKLSLRWDTREHWKSVTSALGCDRASKTLAAVAIALCAEAMAAGRRTSYSRRRSHYTMPCRYQSPLYTYATVVGAADMLAALDLIDHAKASPGQLGWQSAMRATDDLVDLVRPIIDQGLVMRMPPEPIILRTADKELKDYRETRETRHMRREIEEQNEAISGASLGGGNVVQLAAPLRRIFAEKFSHGGRFYAEGGGWQILPKAERLRLQIDGEPVAEVDYSQFHPALAYASIGLRAPPDAYDVPHVARPLAKIAFNVMLNGSSPNGVRHTIGHKREMVFAILSDRTTLQDAPIENLWQTAEALHPGYAQEASRRAQRLMDALLAKHRPIEALFFAGYGLRLQRLDSEIAEGVMREMRRRGIVVLPVHDSFIVPASKAAELEAVMTDEAAKFGVAVSCKSSSSVPTA